MKFSMIYLLALCAPMVVQAQAFTDDEKSETGAQAERPLEIRFEGRPDAALRLKGRIVSQGHFRSDSDFDGNGRFFDLDGQTEGQVATFFTPRLEYREKQLRVFYEPELGWNAWGRNDAGLPNNYFDNARDGLKVRHRQLWSQWRWGNGVSLRVGYQHFADPSRLFLDHLGGAARVDIKTSAARIAVLVGQLPDDTIQGIAVGDDNFVHDNVFGVIQARGKLGDLQWTGGLYGLFDARTPGRPLNLYTGLIGVRLIRPTLRFSVHALGQTGVWRRSGVNGVDQNIGAWAGQGRLEIRPAGSSLKLRFGAGVLGLSPDDIYDGNDHIGAFFASAKNASPSVYLTEDERRDRYDNIDERISTAWGPLFLNRAGLLVIDAFFRLQPFECWAPKMVFAYGRALESGNALDEDFVGLEATLLNTFPLSKKSAIYLNVHAFVPGGAAAAFVNEVDPTATQTAFGGQLGFDARF